MRNLFLLLLSVLIPLHVQAATDRQIDAGIVLYKQLASAPATPSAGYSSCYSKTDGRRYCRTSAGTEFKMPFSTEIANADIASGAAIDYSKLSLSNSILNADINASAAIVDTKLAQLTTAGKVANSATTATPNATNDAIVARDSSGGFVANKIQHEQEALLKAIATPTTPSAGYVSLYAKSDDKIYKRDSSGIESEVGSGGGGGGSGINLITYDTAANLYAPTKSDNFNLDAAIGDWLAYADAAGTEPVDMTGGSPGTTCARDTTTEINGTGSLKMDLGSGSSRQGEGCSILVNVPAAYRGKNVAFTFPFVASGALVEDDIRLAVYDVTNGAKVDVYSRGKVIGTNGQAIGVVAIPASAAQIRVGIHVARTSTAALYVIGDDFQVSPQIPAQGAIVTKWTSYVPTYTGFGTVTNSNMEWRRNGDHLEIRGSFVAGTATATGARLSLPSGLTSIAMTAFPQRAGSWTQSVALAGNGHVLIGSGVTYLTFGYETGAIAGLTEQDGSGIIASGTRMSINADWIPIAGWESNINLSDSSTFYISSFLANGTRVTGAQPSKLGEWRSQLRQGGGRTYSDTNAIPTANPTAADGIKAHAGNTWASTDTTSNPTRYDIFVGKNKNVKIEWYLNTGKTGFIDTTPFHTDNADFGFITNYDPITGVVTVNRSTVNGSNSLTHHLGTLIDGSRGASAGNAIYFDIKVSENALAVTSENPAEKGVYVGVHDSTCAWESNASGSWNDQGADASCAYSARLDPANRSVGTVVGSTTATGPQLQFTPRKTTLYEVCVVTQLRKYNNSGYGGVRLYDGSNVLVSTSVTHGSPSSFSIVVPGTLCGIYSGTANSTGTIKLQVLTADTYMATGNQSVGPPAVDAATWTIKEL